MPRYPNHWGTEGIDDACATIVVEGCNHNEIPAQNRKRRPCKQQSGPKKNQRSEPGRPATKPPATMPLPQTVSSWKWPQSSWRPDNTNDGTSSGYRNVIWVLTWCMSTHGGFIQKTLSEIRGSQCKGKNSSMQIHSLLLPFPDRIKYTTFLQGPRKDPVAQPT